MRAGAPAGGEAQAESARFREGRGEERGIRRMAAAPSAAETGGLF